MSHRIRFARRNWPRFASNQCFVLSPLLKKISRGLGNVVCLSVTLVRIIIEMETNRSLWPFVTRFFFLLSFMSRLHLFLASLLFMSLHYNNRAKSTHTHYRHHTRRRSIWIEWIRQLCAHPSNSHIWCIWNGPTLIKNELTIFFIVLFVRMCEKDEKKIHMQMQTVRMAFTDGVSCLYSFYGYNCAHIRTQSRCKRLPTHTHWGGQALAVSQIIRM